MLTIFVVVADTNLFSISKSGEGRRRAKLTGARTPWLLVPASVKELDCFIH